jgi:heme/copper-type cytochrome/quinol oxidase subunit 2
MDALLSAWAGAVIVMGTAVLVTLVALVWIFFFRKKTRRRRRRRRQHNEHQPNPTLAQIGGLPPARENREFSERPARTLVSRL